MQVAAAHAGRLHLDDDIVSLGGGIRELHQFQPAFAREYNAAHRFLRLFCCGLILNPNEVIGKVRTDCELAPLRIRGFLYLPPSAVDASNRDFA
jgi:hypothetical protein